MFISRIRWWWLWWNVKHLIYIFYITCDGLHFNLFFLSFFFILLLQNDRSIFCNFRLLKRQLEMWKVLKNVKKCCFVILFLNLQYVVTFGDRGEESTATNFQNVISVEIKLIKLMEWWVFKNNFWTVGAYLRSE